MCVAIEECEMAHWVLGILKPEVKEVIVSNPKENYWISRDGNK